MELDDAYDNLGHIPGALDHIARWERDATAFREAARTTGRAHFDLSYGKSEREAYDFFEPVGASIGLCVFVHGGYWRRFDRKVFSHLAKGTRDRGWITAIPSYDLCPDVRIGRITRQIAEMVTHAAGQISGPISLVGHSAGGHLVARMLAPGLLSPDVAARLHRVTPISPVADLRPLLKTSMNEDFRLTPEEAASESPVLMSDRIQVPVHVWVGADERPAFLDQARWLAEAWACPLRIASGKHHLDVIDDLSNPESAMVSDVLG